ncbi:hypothetical protein CK203_111455 [Vitis vinifera]|uniref:Uncharacterized protein n=1 Tax=Vitis vinifera TaxID=29760 RepID=A0A438BP13_VITVI|nr:hypothetical protein CK203_111455 [Vitis vinifera]
MTSYIDVWEHSEGGGHIDAGWSPIFEDLYSLELAPRLFRGVLRVAYRWRAPLGFPFYMWVHLWAFKVESINMFNLGSTSWIRVRGILIKVSDQSDQTDMDSQVVTVDQFAAAMASIQEAITSLEARRGGLLTALAPRPPSQPMPPHFRATMCDHNPLLAHTTHLMSPLTSGIHHMDFVQDDVIHMLSWDDGLSEMIILNNGYEIVGVISKFSITTPFSLIPDRAPLQLIPSTPSDVSTHRDALIRALSQIRVETSTTPEGLIHMMTTDRATCIVFFADDLPLKGSDHTRPLYIIVVCLDHRVSSILLDNGSALNVCPLATAIALGFAPLDFGRCQHGSSEFVTTIDHDTPFGLGFISSEDDIRYMARLRDQKFSLMLRRWGLRIVQWMSFNVCFVRCRWVMRPLTCRLLMMITPPSLDRASLFSLCFPDETTDYRVVIEPADMIDGVVPHDEYHDEMDLWIFDINDEIAQPDLDRDSFDHDSDPIDERVSPAIGMLRLLILAQMIT